MIYAKLKQLHLVKTLAISEVHWGVCNTSFIHQFRLTVTQKKGSYFNTYSLLHVSVSNTSLFPDHQISSYCTFKLPYIINFQFIFYIIIFCTAIHH